MIKTVEVLSDKRGGLACIAATVVEDHIVAVFQHDLNSGIRQLTIAVLAPDGTLIHAPQEIPVDAPCDASIVAMRDGQAFLVVLSRLTDCGIDARAQFFRLKLKGGKRQLTVLPLGTWATTMLHAFAHTTFSGSPEDLRLGSVILKSTPSGIACAGVGFARIASSTTIPSEPRTFPLPGPRPGEMHHVACGPQKGLVLTASNDCKRIDLYSMNGAGLRHLRTLATAPKSRGEVSCPRIVHLTDGFAFFWRKWNGKVSFECADSAIWFVTADLLFHTFSEPKRVDDAQRIPASGLEVFPNRRFATITWQDGLDAYSCKQRYAILRKLDDFPVRALMASLPRFEQVVSTSAGLVALYTSFTMSPYRFRLRARTLRVEQ